MAEFDLVVRGAEVATAVDVFRADIGVRDGRIAALAQGLAAGAREIDARGLLVLPGGVDAHCHLDQPTGDDTRHGRRFLHRHEVGGVRRHHDGDSVRRPGEGPEPARGGRGLSPARRPGKAVVDYAFHLIVTDPTPQVLGQELPALIRDGYTSFKIYMTYDSLKLSDRQILDVLALARAEQALVMIHAENADCIALAHRAAGAGRRRRAEIPRARRAPPSVEREATHRAITLAELVDTDMLIVHVSGPRRSNRSAGRAAAACASTPRPVRNICC